MNDEPTDATPEDTTPSQPTNADDTATVDAPMPIPTKTKRQRRLHASGQTRAAFGVSTTFITIFGILLPIGVLITEWISSICAEIYVDPIPTYGHMAMVALVPLANLLVLLSRSPANTIPIKVLDWLTAIAAGSAFFFALVFAPITPFAVIGIIFFGIGFLPLSPLLSLISTLVARRMVRKYVLPSRPPREQYWGRVWKGYAFVLAAILLYAIPQAATIGLTHVAARATRESEPKAVQNLRTYGSEQVLLRLCYAPRAMRRQPIGFLLMEWGNLSINQNKAQRLYYRVTGKPYNASPPPNMRSANGRRDIFSMWDFDPDQGGTSVAGRLRGLFLQTSRLDTVVESDAAHAYTEWTMEFLNQSRSQREARAEIALPPGSVVSRLTLWINGEPQEAAFGTRDQTRAAYQKVVRRRRDPVLITTTGRDRILLQCFPVPPNGGIMKLRVGITSPIPLDTPKSGTLLLPYIAERNFGFVSDFAHTFWAESRHGMKALSALGGTETTIRPDGIHTLRGTLPSGDIEMAAPMRIARTDATHAWHLDARATPNAIIQQSFVMAKTETIDRIALVIDTSSPMRKHIDLIRNAVLSLPANIEFTVITAGDRVGRVSPWIPSTKTTRQQAASALNATRFLGGCDNGPALSTAANELGGTTNTAILWIHAAQPVALQGIAADLARWNQHGTTAPLLFDMQLTSGPNKLSHHLQDYKRYSRVHPFLHQGGIATFYRTHLGAEQLVRRLVATPGIAEGQGIRSTDHLARLWAHSAILTELNAKNHARATELALRYQLVTPVSGAVVLESARQYEEAGLQQGAAEASPSMSVPSVPEPETWALLCIVLAVVVAGLLHRRREFCMSRN